MRLKLDSGALVEASGTKQGKLNGFCRYTNFYQSSKTFIDRKLFSKRTLTDLLTDGQIYRVTDRHKKENIFNFIFKKKKNVGR